MRIIKKSTNVTVMVLVTSATDHISGMDGLTLAVSISKNGGDFEVIAPDIASKSNGWYKITLSSSDTDTIGDLVLHISATGADPTDVIINVAEYTNNELGLMIKELYQVRGLDVTEPATATQGSLDVGDIHIVITGNGKSSTTFTRQP